MTGAADSRGARELAAPYELFILALSILSIGNLILVLLPLGVESRNVVLIVDTGLSAIFLADFAYRLLTAESKRGYFLRGGGWLDLIGSLPALRFARIFRVLRATKQLREYGLRSVGEWLLRERAQSALYVIVLLGVIVLEVSGILVLSVEDDPSSNITSASDALWWGYVTITTVGYGDQFPVTNTGRIVGVFLLTIGVGLFATFTGFLANAFLAPRKEKPARAAGDDPKTRLEAIRRRLEEQERASAELRRNLAEIESLL
jgi:voltage-gated potassium channel